MAPSFNREVAIREELPSQFAMTSAQFEALRQQTCREYTGSGYIDFGTHYTAINEPGHFGTVNQGLFIWSSGTGDYVNNLVFGPSWGVPLTSLSQLSKNITPLVNLHGYVIDLTGTNFHDTPSIKNKAQCNIKFPPAPNGKHVGIFRKLNSDGPTFKASYPIEKYNTTAEAFAAEMSNDTTYRKVLTSREDIVLLEAWEEEILLKDIVYPFGNVQYGLNNYEGIPLVNNLVSQRYSAFGEWDTETTGFGVKWSTLTIDQKNIFISEPKNNIYYDVKTRKYIQVRYRIRVLESLPGMNTERIEDGYASNLNSFNCLFISNDKKDYGFGNYYINPRGAKVEFFDFSAPGLIELNEPVSTRRGFYGGTNYNVKDTYTTQHETELNSYCAFKFTDVGVENDESVGFNGKCFAMRVCAVTRLNQGAFHPGWNPFGTANSNVNGTVSDFTGANAASYTSLKACFDIASGGTYSSGQCSQHLVMYHDIVYSSQVIDYRIDVNRVSYEQLVERELEKAIKGNTRGIDYFPTIIKKDVDWPRGNGNILYLKFLDGGKSVLCPDGGSYLNGSLEIGDICYIRIKSIPLGSTLTANLTMNSWIACTVGGPDSKGSYIVPTVTGNAGIFSLFTEGNLTLEIMYFGNPTSKRTCYYNTNVRYSGTDMPYIDVVGVPSKIVSLNPEGLLGQWNPTLPSAAYVAGTAPQGNKNIWPLNRELKPDSSTIVCHPVVTYSSPWSYSIIIQEPHIFNDETISAGFGVASGETYYAAFKYHQHKFVQIKRDGTLLSDNDVMLITYNTVAKYASPRPNNKFDLKVLTKFFPKYSVQLSSGVYWGGSSFINSLLDNVTRYKLPYTTGTIEYCITPIIGSQPYFFDVASLTLWDINTTTKITSLMQSTPSLDYGCKILPILIVNRGGYVQLAFMYTQARNNGTTWDETQTLTSNIPQYLDHSPGVTLKIGMKIVDIPIGLINSLSDFPN